MLTLPKNITIGSDPEMFLTNGKHAVSAIDKFPGDKANPVEWAEGIKVQVDNCSVEYNTPVCTDRGEWVRHHLSAYRQIAEHAAKAHNLKPLIAPSVIFPMEELDDERAWIMGCEPDFNAWVKEWNPKPYCDIEELRSGGGHIHVGFPDGTFTADMMIHLTKLVDMWVGVPLLLVDHDDRRRELYGKAGAMRFKPYGMEWRTGSNAWIQTEQRMAWVYDGIVRAVQALGEIMAVPPIVREIIDTGNRIEAAKFCEHYNIEVPQ